MDIVFDGHAVPKIDATLHGDAIANHDIILDVDVIADITVLADHGTWQDMHNAHTRVPAPMVAPGRREPFRE